ncbi:MAG: SPOR domain-containing protein [Flavobacterium sp.]|nr:SPOR domain-containing protein [Pedobacter sp.]
MKPVFFTALAYISFLFATEAYSQQPGKVEVIKDPQIDSLIARRLALSKVAVKTTGFRVQVFSGPDRKDAYIVQSKFKALYPRVTSYVSYNQPNYRVRVGDFRSRIEAEKMISRLKRHYQTLFIFSERINPR